MGIKFCIYFLLLFFSNTLWYVSWILRCWNVGHTDNLKAENLSLFRLFEIAHSLYLYQNSNKGVVYNTCKTSVCHILVIEKPFHLL